MQPKKLKQTGIHTFSIVWEDGVEMSYLLSRLQKMCPCSSCAKEKRVDDSVVVSRITSVGRYGLKLHFTSGCTRGVYTYTLLRRVGQ